MEIMEFGVQRLYMKEIRRKKCRRLLMKGEIQHIEIKCPKCGYIQKFEAKGGDEHEVVKYQK